MKNFALTVLLSFATLAAARAFAADSARTDDANDAAAPNVRELFADPTFETGFVVSASGKPYRTLRLPFDDAPDAAGTPDAADAPESTPFWTLARHGSRWVADEPKIDRAADFARASDPGAFVERRRLDSGETLLTLGVSTDAEYDAPRRADQLWTHLLLQTDWAPADRVSFGNVDTLVFSVDARVADATRLSSDAEFDPNLHTTQASVYFAISNDDPDSPDYRDYIWFGVSFFDDRTEIQPNYVEIDGDPKKIGTGKLIYRIGEQKTIDDVCGGVNPYSRRWTRVEIDLRKYVDAMLATARERGLLTRTTVDELKLAHFNFGWETPGTYRAALEIKNPKLTATTKKR